MKFLSTFAIAIASLIALKTQATATQLAVGQSSSAVLVSQGAERAAAAQAFEKSNSISSAASGAFSSSQKLKGAADIAARAESVSSSQNNAAIYNKPETSAQLLKNDDAAPVPSANEFAGKPASDIPIDPNTLNNKPSRLRGSLITGAVVGGAAVGGAAIGTSLADRRFRRKLRADSDYLYTKLRTGEQ